MASISSMKMIQGAFSFAVLNRSRTLDAPTPTNISTKSEPDKEKKGTLASPATAFANKVFPVPGGPINKAPFGILPPKTVYFLGFFKKSTISSTSYFAPSKPATSLNETVCCVLPSKSCALDLPILNNPPPPAPPRMDRIEIRKKIKIPNDKIIQIASIPQPLLVSCLMSKLNSFSTTDLSIVESDARI